jgi:ankyrin repeat protein
MAQHRLILPLLVLALASPAMAATKHKAARPASSSAGATADQLIVKRNYKAAFDVLSRTARAGNPKAMVKLANAFRFGLGTQRDEAAALAWYQKAAAAGSKEASLSLQRRQVSIPPTPKKTVLNGGSDGAIHGVDYAHLPQRPKGSPDWTSIAAAQKNHAVLKALKSESAGNVQLIQASLGDGDGLKAAQISSTDQDGLGRTALMIAIVNNRPEAMAALLAAKPNFSITDKQGFSAAGIAARQCDSAKLDQLAAAGDTLAFGKVAPAVVAAAACNDWSALKTSFAKANLSAQDTQGRGIAFYAATKGNVSLLGWLAEKGVDLSTADAQGFTPLHSAAQYKHGMAFRFILGRTDKIDVTSARGITPLMLAAHSGCLECITAAVGAKTDLDMKNADGDTALLIAVRTLQGDAAQTLADSGASQTAKNNAGDTPLKLAKRLGMISP